MEQCSLFGIFGGVMQLTLASICFVSLFGNFNLVKRYYEHPPRPLIIFILDTSKQIVSAILAHVMNLMAAVILTNRQGDENPCCWYFINISIDCTVGVFSAYTLLKLVEKISWHKGWLKLISGYYSELSEDEVDLGIWALQLMCWGTIIITVIYMQTKWILIILIIIYSEQLSEIGNYILEPLASNPREELIVIMICVPLLFNIIQLWVCDSFLKAKPGSKSPAIIMRESIEKL